MNFLNNFLSILLPRILNSSSSVQAQPCDYVPILNLNVDTSFNNLKINPMKWFALIIWVMPEEQKSGPNMLDVQQKIQSAVCLSFLIPCQHPLRMMKCLWGFDYLKLIMTWWWTVRLLLSFQVMGLLGCMLAYDDDHVMICWKTNECNFVFECTVQCADLAMFPENFHFGQERSIILKICQWVVVGRWRY